MTPVGSPNTPAGFSSSSREFQEDPEIILKKKNFKKRANNRLSVQIFHIPKEAYNK